MNENIIEAKGSSFLQVHPKDNVLVALRDLPAGTMITFNGDQFGLKEPISAKHKFFIEDLAEGDEVIMYGVLVGKVQYDVPKGGLMTTANTKHASGDYAYRHVSYKWQPPDVSKFAHRTFNGYKRKDGRVGTANYWLFIPMVFCENRNLDRIKEAMNRELGYGNNDKYNHFTRLLLKAHQEGTDLNSVEVNLQSSGQEDRYFKNVDGIKFLNHTGGCGGTRQDAATLGSLLAAYANHPNVGGVTVLSLGCQHLQLQDFQNDLKALNPGFDKPLFLFEQQQAKSEEELIFEAIRKTFTGLIEINQIKREPAPLSALTIGVKCGGSDGFSGISANPAVGYTSDLVVALGGKVLLAEFPELCGAEQELIDRCSTKESADKFIDLMHTYDNQARQVGSGFHMNASGGNI